MAQAEYEIVYQGMRVLFLLGLPVVAAVSLAGTLAAALQAATTIQDPAIGYAARLGALVAVLYFLLPSLSGSDFLGRASFSASCSSSSRWDRSAPHIAGCILFRL